MNLSTYAKDFIFVNSMNHILILMITKNIINIENDEVIYDITFYI